MKVTIQKVNPSNNIIPPVLYNQFHFRKYKEFKGKSEVALGIIEEPLLWNRPLIEQTDQLLKLEYNNIYSFNLPFALTTQKWKSNYNIMINKNNAPLVIHLGFKNNLSSVELHDLKQISTKALLITLLELNIPENTLTFINNDLLLNGKKISGGECIIKDNVYEEDSFLNLKYEEEKELFNNLSGGSFKLKNGITGIFDEFDLKISSLQFLEIYRKNLEILFNEFLEKIKDTNELINL